MKKVLVVLGFLSIFAFSSCSVEDDLELRFEPLRVTDVNFPADLEANETYKVDVTYVRPSSCHYFEGFDYESTGETQTTVFLIASVLDEQPCQELHVEAETSFDFNPENGGVYIFRFWQGKDENGNDIYYTIDVLVD